MSKHPQHYYENGDVILIVEDTLFRVHKQVLQLASPVFDDLFNLASSSEDNLTKVPLSAESAEEFGMFLSYLYPTSFVEINWDNVKILLHFGDKYMCNKVLLACECFLQRNIRRHPLKILLVAEEFHLKTVYREASKLVLDNFFEHQKKREFQSLSLMTREKLHLDFFKYTSSLNDVAVYWNTFKNNNYSTARIFNEICSFPLKPPSHTAGIFLSYCAGQSILTPEESRCEEYFKNFMPLDIEKHTKDPTIYPSIDIDS
ncbi:hypothetical protein G9A89_001154 [Geosiphon pyriformis]|nr:hypothetical protein G9A89_001154 [Geosiphon pyriformis]